jgi:hypothetical protein
MSAAFYTTPGVNYIGLVCGPTLSKVVTVLTGQGVLKRGQILGKNAGGKYTTADLPPLAILADDVDTAGGDVQAVVYWQGKFKANAVILMTAQTLDAQREALRDCGIYLDSVMGTTGLIVRSVEASQEPFLAEKFEDQPPPPPPVGVARAMAEGAPIVDEVVREHAEEGYEVLTKPMDEEVEPASKPAPKKPVAPPVASHPAKKEDK